MPEETKDWAAEHAERLERIYQAEVDRGEHDDDCEYDVAREFYLCHCSKRRREAAGITKPPRADLQFPPPSCPRCNEYLDSDGEGWECEICCLTWDYNGAVDSVRFTDDHGDDLDAIKENWLAARARRLDSTAEANR